MKYIQNLVIVMTILMVSIQAQAQQSEKNPFAGAVFEIDNYVDGKFDNSEDLSFSDTHVERGVYLSRIWIQKGGLQSVEKR